MSGSISMSISVLAYFLSYILCYENNNIVLHSYTLYRIHLLNQ